MTQAAVTSPASEARINTFLARVYLLMFVGLAITGLVSYWVSENLRFQFRLLSSPWIGFGLLIIQIIVVVVLSANVMKMNTGVAALLFLLYSALVGLSLSSIFIIYSDDQIYSVFFITSATFLVTSVVGMLIKKTCRAQGISCSCSSLAGYWLG